MSSGGASSCSFTSKSKKRTSVYTHSSLSTFHSERKAQTLSVVNLSSAADFWGSHLRHAKPLLLIISFIFSIKSFPLEVGVHSVFLRIHGWHGTSPSFCIRSSACIHKLLEGFFVFRYHFQRPVSLHFFQSYSAFMPLPNLLRQPLDFPVEKSTGHFSVLICFPTGI